MRLSGAQVRIEITPDEARAWSGSSMAVSTGELYFRNLKLMGRPDLHETGVCPGFPVRGQPSEASILHAAEPSGVNSARR